MAKLQFFVERPGTEGLCPEADIVFDAEGMPAEGYSAHAIGHSIFIQADTWEELFENAGEAVECHFGEAKTPDAGTMPAGTHGGG